LARGKPHVSRKMVEDVVTSCIFGPLTYIKDHPGSNDFYSLFAKLLPHKLQSTPNVAIKSMRLELWPKPGDVHGRRPEPDVLVSFFNENNEICLAIMIEVKWGAQQFNYDEIDGRYELSEQWACLPDYLREKAYHVYLVIDKRKAAIEIDKMQLKHDEWFPYEGVNKEDWRNRFQVIGWPDFAKVLREHRNLPLSDWATTVVSFLDKTGEVYVWQGCASAVRKEEIKLVYKKPLFSSFERQLFTCPIYGSKVVKPSNGIVFWKKRRGFIGQINLLEDIEVGVLDSLFYGANV